VAFDVFAIDPESERAQVGNLERVKAERDEAAVAAGLNSLRVAAEAGDNVVPACVEAVQAYATVGEIADVLRGVHGTWQPSSAF
jgi:methylmalonyl-CoA mutase N-terminal domain/subunit